MATYGRDAAAEDLQRALIYHDDIEKFSTSHNLDPAFVAAIGSRETRWSVHYFLGDLDPVTGAARGYGPLQIDIGTDPEWCLLYRTGQKTPAEGIARGCEILVDKYKELFEGPNNILGLVRDPDSVHKCWAAAYNEGSHRVIELMKVGADPDSRDTGHNYGIDVVERWHYFQQHGFILEP